MEKKKAKYVAMFQSNYGGRAGLNISEHAQNNLKARIARAKLVAERDLVAGDQLIQTDGIQVNT
jgi:hypothetical protein